MRQPAHRVPLIALAFVSALAFAACRPRLEVRHDYDPAANFSRVHTFGWLGIQSPALSDFDAKRVENALKAELVRKGFEEKTNGDVFVAAYLGVRPKPDTEWEHDRGFFWTEQLTTSPEGTLIVHVLDPSTRKPIWQGQATGMLQKNGTPESKERNIARAAEKIFADFPPH